MCTQHEIGQHMHKLAGRLRRHGEFMVRRGDITRHFGLCEHGQSPQHAVVTQCGNAFRMAGYAIDHRPAQRFVGSNRRMGLRARRIRQRFFLRAIARSMLRG